MNDCPNAEIRDQLPDLLHDRLDASARAAVTAHVASCVDCRDELELLRGVHGMLIGARAARRRRVDRRARFPSRRRAKSSRSRRVARGPIGASPPRSRCSSPAEARSPCTIAPACRASTCVTPSVPPSRSPTTRGQLRRAGCRRPGSRLVERRPGGDGRHGLARRGRGSRTRRVASVAAT